MRRLLIDASVFITLAGTEMTHLLDGADGTTVVPAAVAEEIADESAASRLEEAVESGRIEALNSEAHSDTFRTAASHLGEPPPSPDRTPNGDVALLAQAIDTDDAVVVTDDKPLRKTCKALGISVSGSIGVVIAAVERGDLDPEEAKDALVAMDEVGAHLSARLLRRAERMIDNAAGETD